MAQAPLRYRLTLRHPTTLAEVGISQEAAKLIFNGMQAIPAIQLDEIVLRLSQHQRPVGHLIKAGVNVNKEEVSGQNTYVAMLHNESCTAEVLTKIAEWCEYHVDDAAFKADTTFDTFDEDEYEKEADELKELPCYFDYHFMVTLGGGETLKKDNLPLFYNVMIAAEFLELKDLVLLGGKYICRQISGQTPDYVRELLGIRDDLDRVVSEGIIRDAAAHFTAPVGRPN